MLVTTAETNESTDFRVEDFTIEGPQGTFGVRSYVPSAPSRGLVWVLGGALAFRGLDDTESDWVSRELAVRGTAVVDCRFASITALTAAMLSAPEPDGMHFPVASEEVAAAFLWATTYSPEILAAQRSLGRASTGAYTAAGNALRLRDQGGITPWSLLLAYGLFHAVLLDRQRTTGSVCRPPAQVHHRPSRWPRERCTYPLLLGYGPACLTRTFQQHQTNQERTTL